jgi:hypothetical protein
VQISASSMSLTDGVYINGRHADSASQGNLTPQSRNPQNTVKIYGVSASNTNLLFTNLDQTNSFTINSCTATAES